MRIGVLTGGGDCPGLNTAIWAIVKEAERSQIEVWGIKEGWKGLMTDFHPMLFENLLKEIEQCGTKLLFQDPYSKVFPENLTQILLRNEVYDHIAPQKLTREGVSGIEFKGGTILKSSRINPFKKDGGAQLVLNNFSKLELDALIAIGGEDTLGTAAKLSKLGMPVVGIPKTIDNDLPGTDYTIGFQTAVDIVRENLERLKSTAESHHRIMILEVMGRHAGWLALYGGMAANIILIPEVPFNAEEICAVLRARFNRGENHSLIVIAEGVKIDENIVAQFKEKDEFGHERLGNVSKVLETIIREKTGFDTRATILGHVQRGGAPCQYDFGLATLFGAEAMNLIRQNNFGRMVSLRGNKITDVPLERALSGLKLVKPESIIYRAYRRRVESYL